jgi:phosphoribosylaminoimidazole-succinocarboxamide synthase
LDAIYKGSVKDLYRSSQGVIFCYSDRYSIFDWGEMPDLIPNKGLNLAKMQVWSYRLLEKFGIKTHLMGFYENQISSKVEVEEFQRFQCQYDEVEKKFCYQAPGLEKELWALPLEVIFRFNVYRRSSFYDRLDDTFYLTQLGLSEKEIQDLQRKKKELPAKQDHFELPRPIVEYFTKLEPQDRLLTLAEAREISGLSFSQIQTLSDKTLKVAQILKKYLEECQIELGDGKLEWGMNHRSSEFILIDTIGPDELRMTYQGIPLSKELLRIYYRNTDWYQKVEEAKIKAKEAKDPDWRKYLPQSSYPPSLPKNWILVLSKIYEYFGSLDTKRIRVSESHLIEQIRELI